MAGLSLKKQDVKNWNDSRQRGRIMYMVLNLVLPKEVKNFLTGGTNTR